MTVLRLSFGAIFLIASILVSKSNQHKLYVWTGLFVTNEKRDKRAEKRKRSERGGGGGSGRKELCFFLKRKTEGKIKRRQGSKRKREK